jgi:hypothetical protein
VGEAASGVLGKVLIHLLGDFIGELAVDDLLSPSHDFFGDLKISFVLGI